MKLSLEKLADLTGGKILRGDPCFLYSGVSSLAEADKDEISFLGNEKYFHDFLKTKAGLVIVPPNLPELPSEDVALLEVTGNPSVAFNEAVKYFLSPARSFVPGIHPSAVISETAQFNRDKVSIAACVVIEDGATIGDGCVIGAGCYIGTGAIIGEGTRLFPHVVVRERCRLGKNNVIQPNATIGSDGFGYLMVDGRYEAIDQVGIVETGDAVEIGANATVDRARFGKTTIGEGTKIDNLVQIGHNCTIGKHTIIVSQSGIAGSTTVGNYVTVAAQCGIAGHLHLGDGITLAARTGVISDLEGGKRQVYWGSPCSTYTEACKQYAAIKRLPEIVKDLRKIKASKDSNLDK